MKQNIAVIFGGVSCEHDISIISAVQAMKNIDVNYYNIIPIYITKSGAMLTGKKLLNIDSFSNFNNSKTRLVSFCVGSNYLFVKTIFGYRKSIAIDVALIVMHGENGEDGKVVSLLNMCGIPHTACSGLNGELCLDKCVFKEYLKGIGIKTIKGVNLFSYDYYNNPEKHKKNIYNALGYPLIIKPATLGSSIGIVIAHNKQELEEGLAVAFKYCNKVLIEKFLQDIVEVNVAVMGCENNLIVSETEQPINKSDILSFDNKYLQGDVKGMQSLSRVIPAKVDSEVTTKIKNIAKHIFLHMGLKGVVRFDFIVDKNNNIYVNELNSIPGSLAFYLFEPVGIKYNELINKLLKFAYVEYNANYNLIKTFSSSVLDGCKLGKGVKNNYA